MKMYVLQLAFCSILWIYFCSSHEIHNAKPLRHALPEKSESWSSSHLRKTFQDLEKQKEIHHNFNHNDAKIQQFGDDIQGVQRLEPDRGPLAFELFTPGIRHEDDPKLQRVDGPNRGLQKRYAETNVEEDRTLSRRARAVEDDVPDDVSFVVLLPITVDDQAEAPVTTEGITMLGAIPEAVEAIHNDTTLLPGVRLVYNYSDTACDVKLGLTAAADAMENFKKDAIIGGGCDAVCDKVGLLAFHYQVPAISWGCTSPRLSDNSRYGTLSRLVGPLKKVSRALYGLCEEFEWRNVLVMAAEVHYWQTIGISLKGYLEEHDINVPDFPTIYEQSSDKEIQELLEKARQQATSEWSVL